MLFLEKISRFLLFFLKTLHQVGSWKEGRKSSNFTIIFRLSSQVLALKEESNILGKLRAFI